MGGTRDALSIIRGLEDEDEGARKLAAFHLQNVLGEDRETAAAFVKAGGMPAVMRMVMNDNGNTLAYALGSLNGVLEYDLGWESVEDDILARSVDLVVSRPVINVLRNAFHLLVLVVSRQQRSSTTIADSKQATSTTRGPTLESLKPILKEHRNFLDALVEKLTSADHALCANALQLLNALLRDGITTFSETQLMRFIKRLQDLQAFMSVENIMRGGGLSDVAAAVLDFQTLTKVLLRCWRFIPVDLNRGAHHDAFVNMQHIAAAAQHGTSTSEAQKAALAEDGEDRSRLDIPWTVFGFTGQDPVVDFKDLGLLGLMDLTDFVTKNTEFVKKTLLEQSVIPEPQRCPIARVSLAVTRALFDHFDISNASATPRSDATMSAQLQSDLDLTIRPLLLSRDRLHCAVSHAFFRLWTSAEATSDEFYKIEALVRLLVNAVVGSARRQVTVTEIEEQIGQITFRELRRWQLDELDRQQERAWGSDLDRLKERLREESLAFMHEQRIRCLLAGSWFPSISGVTSNDPHHHNHSRPSSPSQNTNHSHPGTTNIPASVTAWLYAQLSPDRRYLHHITYARRPPTPPHLSEMQQRIDVHHISSVVSKSVSAPIPDEIGTKAAPSTITNTANTTTTTHTTTSGTVGTVTRLLIHGSSMSATDMEGETPLLELHCTASALAAEWLDGLLMLLDQRPITADTEKLVQLIEGWSLRVRMLALGLEGVDVYRSTAAGPEWHAERGAEKGKGRAGAEWDRPEGLDGEYWYDMGEGT